MLLQFNVILAVLLYANSVSANIGRGIVGHASRSTIPASAHKSRLEHRRSHHHHHLHARASTPSTEAQEAAIKSSKEACTPYYLPAVNDLVPHYPTVWTVADIVSGDTQALAVFNAINSSGTIPTGIKPRGSPPASYSGQGVETGYDDSTDPACYWTATGCSKPKAKGLLPDITTCQEPHTWGYTFDDGPNCTHNALYDYWASVGQKVSLMYIGSNVMDWPLQAQRGIVDGHHICVHTWSHNYMTALTTREAFAELYYTMKAIKDIMGITPTCWRPPYGDVDDRIRAIAQGLGLRTYIWSGDTNDWNIEPYGSEPTASIKANYASLKSIGASKAAQTGGIIVLEHEIELPSMKLAMSELPSIKKSWKHVVPLSACLNITKPYAEDITYPNFAEYVGGNTKPSGLPNPPTITYASIKPQGTLAGGSGLMSTKKHGGPQS